MNAWAANDTLGMSEGLRCHWLSQVVASHLAPGVTKTDTLYRHFNILTKGELSNLDNIVLFWNQWRLFDSFS